MLQIKINGQSIFAGPDAPVNLPSGVALQSVPEGSPPFLPFIDTVSLWVSDGQANCYWRRSVPPTGTPDDKLQVFISFTGASGPWKPASDPTCIQSGEQGYTIYVGYDHEPVIGEQVWLFVRGTRDNGDVAYSPVTQTQIS